MPFRVDVCSRDWWVSATPAKGCYPSECGVDPLTGRANNVVTGPFSSVIEAADFVQRKRHVNEWVKVGIQSRRKLV